MNIKQLLKENADLVLKKETSVPGLYVLKYKRKVFFDNLWNPFLEVCRGTVIDENDNIVSLPFTKIYNFRVEDKAPDWADDDVVLYVRKINGFMVACTWYDGDLLWSTTGSLDSEFIGYAQEMFAELSPDQREMFKDLLRQATDTTYIFECCHPSDPHIIEEKSGLYLLGAREKKFDSEIMINPRHDLWHAMGIETIPVECDTVAEVVALSKKVHHEGFVMYRNTPEGQQSAKIKSPYYLQKKALMRGNWEKFLNRESKFELDEEFYGLHQHIHEVERERFFELDEMARRDYIEKFFRERYGS